MINSDLLNRVVRDDITIDRKSCGCSLPRLGDRVKRVYIISNKRPQYAVLECGIITFCRVDKNNIVFLRESDGVGVYRIDFFEKDENLPIFLSSTPYAEWKMGILFENEIEENDTMKIGYTYEHFTGKQKNLFSSSFIVKINTLGEENLLLYGNGYCGIRRLIFSRPDWTDRPYVPYLRRKNDFNLRITTGEQYMAETKASHEEFDRLIPAELR